MRTSTGVPAPSRAERMRGDLLQTVAAIASVLGFLISLGALVPFLGAAPRDTGASPDVLRLLTLEGKVAVLIFSIPIFGLLVTVPRDLPRCGGCLCAPPLWGRALR